MVATLLHNGVVSELRSSERLAIAYFLYVAAIAPFYIAAPWRALLLAAAVAGGLWMATKLPASIRDFAPLGATLTAYREMDWFSSLPHDHHLEKTLGRRDRAVLD
jgi:hypothetical protein